MSIPYHYKNTKMHVLLISYLVNFWSPVLDWNYWVVLFWMEHWYYFFQCNKG